MGKNARAAAILLGALAVVVGGLAFVAGAQPAPGAETDSFESGRVSLQVPDIGVLGCVPPPGSNSCIPG